MNGDFPGPPPQVRWVTLPLKFNGVFKDTFFAASASFRIVHSRYAGWSSIQSSQKIMLNVSILSTLPSKTVSEGLYSHFRVHISDSLKMREVWVTVYFDTNAGSYSLFQVNNENVIDTDRSPQFRTYPVHLTATRTTNTRQICRKHRCCYGLVANAGVWGWFKKGGK